MKKSSFKRLFVHACFASLLLSSSALVAEGGHKDPTLDDLPAGIDWSAAEVITLQLDDDVFVPEEIKFEKNKPYKLILNNISDQAKHDLVDLSFFHSIVIKRVTVAGVSVNTPHVHNLMLRPNSKANLFFVPITTGEYEVFCSVPDHRENGMESVFNIVN